MRANKMHGIAGAAAALAVLLAVPAIGAATSHTSGQPRPGAAAQKVTSVASVPKQPAADAPAKTPTRHFATVPRQPVNLSPQKSTGFKAGAQLRHSKHDKGVKGLRPTRDHGQKNLPVQKG
jgi:hypothetical protein